MAEHESKWILRLGKPDHILIHKDKMTEASAHDEQMKYFMRTKILMSGVKKRELQCIYDPTDCVNNPTGEQPAKGSNRQAMDDRTEYKDTDPAHGNIDHRRNHFGQVIQRNLMPIPINASDQTAISNGYPRFGSSTRRQTGV